ncbi:hypothetical protein FQN54_004736 [Arachnomyces sp. PD_36]|nr:hypothetical protein FQN54_004736 [Arachnomyces sp. PD_36]
MAPSTRNTDVVREAGLGISAGKAGPCKQGSLVLFSGPYVGRGESLEYWRERLGWMGEKPIRAVYNRYEAVGDPSNAELSPGVRFVWVVTRGEWVEKSAVRGAESRRKVMRARPRGEDGPRPSQAAPVRKRGPGRPKKGAVGGQDPPPAPTPVQEGGGTKRKEPPSEAEEPTGETTAGRPKRVRRQPRRNQN